MRGADGRAKLHADIAHPINSACREVIQSAVLRSFNEEKVRSRQPGYTCRYDDYDGDYEDDYTQIVSEMRSARPNPEGFRSDAPHPAPRGAHSNADQGAKTNSRDKEFGNGIL